MASWEAEHQPTLNPSDYVKIVPELRQNSIKITAGLEPDHLALLRRLSVPQPFGTASQPVRVRGATHPATTLIACTFPPDQVRALSASGHPIFRALHAVAFRLVELPTGHYPMLARPADLTRLLTEAAR